MYFCKLPGKNMSLTRILAILKQEVYLTRHSFEIIVDFVFFTFINAVVFGFISVWLSGENRLNAFYLIIGMNLWTIVSVTCYSFGNGTLWNIWSRNLTNLFITPLTISEYLSAHAFSAFLKSLGLFAMTAAISFFFFGFNLFELGLLNTLLYFINLSMFGWSLGLIVLGTIFRFGTRIQALAWSTASLFQPLSASLYPVKILPPVLQTVAYLLPPTYVFEAARYNITASETQWPLITMSFGLNLLYLVFAVVIFRWFYAKSKEVGQFAKNNG